ERPDLERGHVRRRGVRVARAVDATPQRCTGAARRGQLDREQAGLADLEAEATRVLRVDRPVCRLPRHASARLELLAQPGVGTVGWEWIAALDEIDRQSQLRGARVHLPPI